jgi:predicted RNA polymerase sigma factor
VHAVRADLLRRLGRPAAAVYDAALARPANEVERAFLRERRAVCGAGSRPAP